MAQMGIFKDAIFVIPTIYVDNGNKAAVRNEMLSFLWSCKVTSSGPMECPLLYNG